MDSVDIANLLTRDYGGDGEKEDEETAEEDIKVWVSSFLIFSMFF